MDPAKLPEWVFCRLCGRQMAAGSTCPDCGWYDWTGVSPHLQRLVLRRQAALLHPVLPPAEGSPAPLDAPPAIAPPVSPPEPEPAGYAAPVAPGVQPAEGASPPIETAAEPHPVARTDGASAPDAGFSASSETPRPVPVAAVVPPPNRPLKSPTTPGASRASTPVKPRFGPRMLWKRYLPPVRLVWIFLGIIVWWGGGFVSRAVALPLVLLPVMAAVADLGFQKVRFPKWRFPDAAIANGLFLTVILWPTSFSLAVASVALATVALRHLVRVAGRPILNPAAAGVMIAATIFALPQPWHVGSTLPATAVVLLLGLILWTKAVHTWRIWAVYFVTNIVLSVGIAGYLGGVHAIPLVLQATALGASTVFYGMFMVTEPRTAPSARRPMIAFGAIVGVAAAVLPTLFAEYPVISALGVLCPYLALFAGNLFTLALPTARGVRKAAPSPTRTAVRPLIGAADADG